MTFAEKFKKAMQDLNLNQKQVCTMTGCGKSSISQYLSGKNVPSKEKQSTIAVSLGLSPDYFAKDVVEAVESQLLRKNSGIIPRIRPDDAAKLMRLDKKTIRDGLEQGEFSWGYAIKRKSSSKNTYFINANAFAAKEMIEIPTEMIF